MHLQCRFFRTRVLFLTEVFAWSCKAGVSKHKGFLDGASASRQNLQTEWHLPAPALLHSSWRKISVKLHREQFFSLRTALWAHLFREIPSAVTEVLPQGGGKSLAYGRAVFRSKRCCLLNSA